MRYHNILLFSLRNKKTYLKIFFPLNLEALAKTHALVKRGYLMIIEDSFSYFSLKPYVVTPHVNPLVKRVQMRGYNICLYSELTKIIPNYYQILSLI